MTRHIIFNVDIQVDDDTVDIEHLYSEIEDDISTIFLVYSGKDISCIIQRVGD